MAHDILTPLTTRSKLFFSATVKKTIVHNTFWGVVEE